MGPEPTERRSPEPEPEPESINEEDIKVALKDALERKTEGNAAFKAERWNDALGYYEAALARLPPRPAPPKKKPKETVIDTTSDPPEEAIQSSSNDNQEPERVLSAIEKACTSTRAILNGNMSACYLKLGQHQSVVDACTQALLDDPHYVKILHRRASSNEQLATWSAFSSAKKDYETLLGLLESGSPLLPTVRKSLVSLQPRLDAAQQKETQEMLGKLKNVGNSLLGMVGLSTDNFKFEPNGSGGYSMKFSPQ